MKGALRFGTYAFVVASLASCRDSLPTYLLSQGLQQGSLYLGARPVDEVLKDPSSDPTVKRYLKLSREVLAFASKNLEMKTNGNYKTYVALKNRWVSHVVVAARKDRMEAHLFKYPFFGGLPYRGYFQLQDARDFADTLRGEDLDVYVRPVPAYSTTGWLADPIVTSMFESEVAFIDIMFHELVHVQFYINGEADFNEAFATWFAARATERFIKESDFSPDERVRMLAELKASREHDLLKTKWIHKILTRARSFYDSKDFKGASEATREKMRESFFAKLSQELASAPGLETWSKIEWNNAVLVSLSTYNDLVADIEKYAVTKKISDVELLKAARENAEPILQALRQQQDLACRSSSSQSSPALADSSDPSACSSHPQAQTLPQDSKKHPAL